MDKFDDRQNSSKPLSVWDLKPWWCQPWTILLTGILLIVGSWILFQTVWITVGLSSSILLWWFYFLIVYPKIIEKF